VRRSEASSVESGFCHTHSCYAWLNGSLSLVVLVTFRRLKLSIPIPDSNNRLFIHYTCGCKSFHIKIKERVPSRITSSKRFKSLCMEQEVGAVSKVPRKKRYSQKLLPVRENTGSRKMELLFRLCHLPVSFDLIRLLMMAASPFLSFDF
jgi:hypothetical protein